MTENVHESWKDLRSQVEAGLRPVIEFTKGT